MSRVEPAWMIEAKKYHNLSEIPGPKHNKIIVDWFRELGYPQYNNDETPWCGAFVAIAFKHGNPGIRLPKVVVRALDWLNWGQRLKEPVYGCVGVMARKGGGHVTFIVGKTPQGHLVGYGGNQDNRVIYSVFPMDRFTSGGGFVYPSGVPFPKEPLPIVDSKGIAITKSEA